MEPAIAIGTEAAGIDDDETSRGTTPADSNDSVSGVSDNIDEPHRESIYEELLTRSNERERGCCSRGKQ